ncbi:DUF1453 domain-containing protein [Lentzea sp. NBRC 102530]|uniref:DUF1453 domain-containing protein n=1 Tax=Lentzea sp. NBRC 102530 TaxID=3032201 RepID=UPI0024A36125|nr:DUF1453 domain-containing protein [Lentzea sp. NBRC 102530]GLY46699.1 hypothetical protein Lesp01_03550 [Lentzea sp. NBRC 102530]
MNATAEIVLIAAAIVYVLARRLRGEPAVGKRLLLLPAVLGLIGLTQTTPNGLGFLLVSVVLSVAFGVLRGLTIRTYEQHGIVMLRYTATTVVLWVASIAARFAVGFLLAPGGAQSNGLMLVVGAGLLAEGLVVMSRAVRVGGQVVWAKGRNGAPHRTSAVLDSWQEKVRETRHDSTR